MRLRPLLAVLVAVCGLAACGSSSSSSSSGDPASVLKDTFGPGKPVRSGKLDLALSLNAKGLAGISGPIRARLTGPFQSTGGQSLPSFAFDLTLGVGGQAFTAGAISTPDKGFLTIRKQAYALDDKLFARIRSGYEQTSSRSAGSQAKDNPSLKALGIDPLRWLKDPRSAGEEDVGGTATRHITAGVDVPKLLDDVNTLLGKAGALGAGSTAGTLPTKLTATQQAAIERSVSSVGFDVWSGKRDGTLRRLLVKVAFAVPRGSRPSVGGLSDGTFALDLNIADLNDAQTIVAPAGARPLSELGAQLQGLIGGATGPSGGSSTSTQSVAPPATPAPASPAPGTSKYTDCLMKAGSDIGAVQKCASLLGR